MRARRTRRAARCRARPPGPSRPTASTPPSSTSTADGAALVLDVLVAVEQAVGTRSARRGRARRSRRACPRAACSASADRRRPRRAARPTSPSPFAATTLVASSATTVVKSPPLATKSVSQLSSTMRADVAVDDHVDRALPSASRSASLPALARCPSRGASPWRALEVAVGLLERALAVHHPGAGLLAQRGDVLGRVLSHRVALLVSSVAASATPSAAGRRRARRSRPRLVSRRQLLPRPAALVSASFASRGALGARPPRRGPAAAPPPSPPAPPG